jgi:hypothetical protein
MSATAIVQQYCRRKDRSNYPALDVRPDGTFELHVEHYEGARGQWHVNSHPFDTGLEFDGSSFAGEYRLTRRFEEICVEVQRDYEYLCKAKK